MAMIQTWHLKNLNETQKRQAFDPETSRPVAQQACNSCRIKKLRCSGQKDGCSRCRTLSQECVYAQPGTRGRGRRRKTEEVISNVAVKDMRSQQSTSESSLPSGTSSSSKAGMLASSPRLEPPTQPCTDSTTSGTSAVEMISFDANDADSLSMSMQIQDLMPPQGLNGSPLSWQHTSGEIIAHQFKNFWDIDILDRETAISFQPPMVRNEAFMQSYDDIQIPNTPRSTSTTTLYSHLGSQAVQASDSRRPSNDQPSHDQKQQGVCQCLQRVVLLLEELDCPPEGGGVQEPDAWLSRLKEALRCGEVLLLCSSCQAKPENVSILGFLADRLTTMCELIVGKYVEILENGQCNGLDNATNAAWLISLGEYEIDCINEWSVLLRAMIIMQLRAVDGLVNRLKGVTNLVNGEGLRRKMDVTQKRILTLLDKVV